MPDSMEITVKHGVAVISSVGSVSMLLVMALGASFGCATTEAIAPPDVTLVDLDFVDATIFESTLDIGVRIFNENPDPLILDGAVIKLELEGRNFGKGTFSERVEVPRLDSVVQRLEMHLSHIAVASKLKTVIDSKVVNYSITGKVYVITPSGRVKRLPIDKQGRIDLRGQGSQGRP
jgi:LEA14-like dessication related protein